MNRIFLGRAAAATSAAAIALVYTASAASAATTLVDQTIDKSLGGAELCLVEKCLPEIKGVKNLHILATFDGPSASTPTITRVSAPGCTANVNVGFALTTPGAGPGGVVNVLVEFDRTDKNGNVIPGSHKKLTGKVVVTASATPKTIDPLVSACGSALE